ncbi:MAG: gamma-glutamyltransferase [Myxococcales bacterium]
MHLAVVFLFATAAVSPHGAVATAHPLASEAGASMLRRGGNAVDAAVAAAFALSVVEPQSSGIGGGGFALVYTARDRQVHIVDFREVAPAAARPDMYLRDGQARQDLANAGALSVAVPGAVRGYVQLLERWGKRPLREVLAPAIALATKGFQVTPSFVAVSEERRDCLAADDEAARRFLRRGEGGEPEPLDPGDKLLQPDLGRTLEAIALRGADGFYKGAVAKAIVKAVQAKGGILTEKDLAAYKVRERTPIEGTYRGYRIVSMPPPSSGGILLIALLNVLEREDPRAGGYRPEHFVHVMAETEKRLFALRQGWGDPDFNPQMARIAHEMTTKDFAGSLRAQIGERATPAAPLVQRETGHTTHLSVVDEEGNAVAMTTTVNDGFGSCMVAKGTGVLLNDQMDDFAVAPGIPNAYGLRGGAENAPDAGKEPLSSMAPTFVFAPSGELRLALGAAGGPTIPTTVAQIIVHVVDDKMKIDEAIAASRLHHNFLPDAIRMEKNGLEAETQKALEARGHVLRAGRYPLGKACAVEVDPATGFRAASADPRFDGAGAIP